MMKDEGSPILDLREPSATMMAVPWETAVAKSAENSEFLMAVHAHRDDGCSFAIADMRVVVSLIVDRMLS